MKQTSTWILCALAALVMAAPASAAAPVAKTTNASNIEEVAVTLIGRVDPNDETTTYHFEYGKNQNYGSQTPDGTATGADGQRVEARIEGLTPNTVYNFRLVATNPSGTSRGANRKVRTKGQPLTLRIAVAPNPVVFGTATVVSGSLTGSSNARRRIVLQQRRFPFSSGFGRVDAVVTDANGGFAFPGQIFAATTQLRAQVADETAVTSDLVTLGVTINVNLGPTRRRVLRHRRVRLAGTVTPVMVGTAFEVQKQTRTGSWATVRRGITKFGGQSFSRFAKRVRVTRTARYRIVVRAPDGSLLPGTSREVRVRAV